MSNKSGLLEQSPRLSNKALLGETERHAATVLNPKATVPILFVCDHASNTIPTGLNSLGLPPAQLQEHIAWDRGTAELAHALAERVAYRTVMCNYSRLVIDCNRRTYDDTLICQVSDEVVVPGNQNLSAQDRNDRIDQIYQPYHRTITESLDELRLTHLAPALISLHSFTPQLSGQPKRPWHVGLLYDKDPRLAEYFLDYFSNCKGVSVGENLPYSGKDLADYTIDHHGEDRGFPCLSIEIRQDLLTDDENVAIWADHIANVVTTIAEDQKMFAVP